MYQNLIDYILYNKDISQILPSYLVKAEVCYIIVMLILEELTNALFLTTVLADQNTSV